MNKQTKINEQVDRFFGKNTSLSFDELVNLVEQTLPTIKVLREAKKELKSITVKMPKIRISEKMWGKAGTEDREILSSLMSGIIARGSTLSEKLRLINDFLNSPPSDAVSISEILSHMVFLDTLTNIMIHFNYSAAGFTFEGFLAALLQGEQVPAGTSGIQDIIDNDENPISLKLVSEKTPEVKGSYADLISHFTDPSKEPPYVTDPESGQQVRNPTYVKAAGISGAMKYIIALKSWNEEELGNAQGQLEGTIKFYEFDFSANSFLEALKSTEANRKLLLLPEALGELDLGQGSEDFDPVAAVGEEVYNNLDGASRSLLKKMASDFTAPAATKYLEELEVIEKSRTKTGKVTLRLVLKGTDKTPRLPHAQTRGLDPRFKKAAEFKEKGYLSFGQSMELLEKALHEGEQVFWDLIKETSGIHGGMQTTFYVHHRYYRRNYENGVGFLGQVRIGREAIAELANKYADVLEQQIFDIYSDLEELSLHLNGYFIGGEKQEGLKAAQTADKIKTGTEELVQTKTI
tara:strand:- start:19264 stop:20823 length:1560 start_codon:yes stop_codon:yes gene_type:complete